MELLMLGTSRLSSRSLRLFAVLAIFASAAPAADLDVVGSSEDRLAFLQGLGGLHKAKGCFLTPVFWERVDVVPGKELHLGMYRIERIVEAANARVEASTLS